MIKRITGWYRNLNYQISIPRHDRISPNTVLQKALTDQIAIGWGRMYSGQISKDFQTVHNVDRPQGSHDHHANAATLSDWALKLITLFFNQVEDQWKLPNEALHGRDRAEIHSSIALYSRPKLLDSTLHLLWKSTCTRPPHPLTTTHRYLRPALCRKGNVRRQKRAAIATALLPAPTFFIDETPLERVTKFRYLGRILSQDDHDLSACVQGPEARGSIVREVLPCNSEHGPTIRKRHMGGH
jgi:hypothetical protein